VFRFSQLADDGFHSAAAAASTATMTPLSSTIPIGRLHQLVLLGLQMEKERGLSTVAASKHAFRFLVFNL
jgi:hypothetical protein